MVFRRPNLLSSIWTLFLGHPIFLEQPSKHNSMDCLSAEHTPISDRVIFEVMFVLDVVGGFAVRDVREVESLMKGEFNLVEPRAVPDSHRPRTTGSTYHPSTSAHETSGIPKGVAGFQPKSRIPCSMENTSVTT
jgi:hypothetical protein